MRMSLSGLPPVTQAAVICFTPAAHPEETIPHSDFVSSAKRFPTASASSSSCTKFVLAASNASLTFGLLIDPPIMV